jgi:hypothetical protein
MLTRCDCVAFPVVQDSGRTPDTSMFPTTTEFSPAMPEAVPEPAAAAEHMTYNSAYETYQEAPLEVTPNRRTSSPSPRCVCWHTVALALSNNTIHLGLG